MNTQTTTKNGTNYYTRNERYCSNDVWGLGCVAHDWRDVTATNHYYVQDSQAVTGWAAIFSGNLQVTGQAVNTGNLTINPTSNLVGNMATTVTPGQNPGSQPVTNTGGAGNPLGSSFTLPSGGLFNVSTAPGQHYLIETNPQFANYGETSGNIGETSGQGRCFLVGSWSYYFRGEICAKESKKSK